MEATGLYGEQLEGAGSCNDYSLNTGRRLSISHRMATSLLSKSRSNDEEETRY